MPDAPAGTADGGGSNQPTLPLGCEPSLDIRQSSTIFLPAPGVRSLNDISARGLPGDGLVATPTFDDQGHVVVAVQTLPGTSSGASFGADDRVITIVSNVDGYQFTRRIGANVSFIYAGPGGSDDNAGTVNHMFASFAKAASVAGEGDTIILGKVSDTAPDPIELPPGITVQASLATDGSVASEKQIDPVQLGMALVLRGDATLDNLTVGARLTIEAPGSHVVLTNFTDDHGLTIDRAAAPDGTGKGTVVELGARTAISNKLEPTLPPLLVEAAGATVLVSDSSAAVRAEAPGTGLENIRLEGAGTTLKIVGNIGIQNVDQAPLIHAVRAASLDVEGLTVIYSILVDDPASTASFAGVSFRSAPILFKGQKLTTTMTTTFIDSPINFYGQSLELNDATVSMSTGMPGVILAPSSPPPPTGGSNSARFQTVTFQNAPVMFTGTDLSISAGTNFTNSPLTFTGGTLTIDGSSFTDSLLTFSGTALNASDTVFDGQGIIQGGADSVGTIQHATIKNYTVFGYRLDKGRVALVDSMFAHDPDIKLSTDPTVPPWAILVESPGDPEGSSVSSEGTTYDTAPFTPTPPMPCTVGCGGVPGIYSIPSTSLATISFCGPN